MNYYQPARYSYSCYSMLSLALFVLNIIYNYNISLVSTKK